MRRRCRPRHNATAAEKRSAEAELRTVKVPEQVSAEDIRTVVEELGDVRALYEALGLEVSDNHETRSPEVALSPALRGFSVGVRGGTRTLTTRLELEADPPARTP